MEEYEGTLRVVEYRGDEALTVKQLEDGEHGDNLDISGDLYAAPPWQPERLHEDIPIFPRVFYRFYLLATALESRDGDEFDLVLSSYELAQGGWTPKGGTTVIARLRWSEPPADGPRSDYYLTGSVLDEDGDEIGELKMYWVSSYLRRGVLEFDRVDNVRLPSNNFDGIESGLLGDEHKCDWQSVFDSCGWKMDIKESDQPAEPPSKVWSDAELHQALPSLRDTFDLNEYWRYHIFCVGKLDDGGRGFKFDVSGGEPGSPLFESIVLAAKFEFLETDRETPEWGNLSQKTLDITPGYFRTAVHEVGHALKLDHNFKTAGFMSTTDTLRQLAADEARKQAEAKQGGDGAPLEIDVVKAFEWRFAPDDLQRLRHWPDQVVRPGGSGVQRFALPGIDDVPVPTIEGGSQEGEGKIPVELVVTPFEEEVPLGAPVRLSLKLTNRGKEPRKVPRLRMKSGNITGSVESPSGIRRSFQTVAETVDELAVEILDPDRSTSGSVTLLRGPDKALFPDHGWYKVKVEVWFFEKGQFRSMTTSTTVKVGRPRDEKHRRVAELLIKTSATLVSFAIGGGDGLETGNQAINLALNNPVLRPYFAVVRLKRLCRNIGRLRGSLDEALRILATDAILTPSEMAGLVGMVLPWRRRTSGPPNAETEAIESAFLLNNYLKADLRYVGTRIVLGHLTVDDQPFQEFLTFLSRKDGVQNQSRSPVQVIQKFGEFLREMVGLNEIESKELVELLLVRETKLADAIYAYVAHPGEENKLKIVKTANDLGLSHEALRRIVGRLHEVVELNSNLIGPDELANAGQSIVSSFEDTSEGAIHEIFVNKLKESLWRAGVLREGSDGGRSKPLEGMSQPLISAVATIRQMLLFFQKNAGLHLNSSTAEEMGALLFEHDSELANAMEEYVANPDEERKRRIREAAKRLDLSAEAFVSVVERLRECVESGLLEKDALTEASKLIKASLVSAAILREASLDTEKNAAVASECPGATGTIEAAAAGPTEAKRKLLRRQFNGFVTSGNEK